MKAIATAAIDILPSGISVEPGRTVSMSNAADLYRRIESDRELTTGLFRQALQNPSGAIAAICEIGQSLGLPVSPDEVKAHLGSLDDDLTKQWLIKARGGL